MNGRLTVNKTYTADVLEDPMDPDGAILQFPEEMLTDLGWVEGDTLNWEVQDDGSAILTKVMPKEETQLVLVEAVSTFRTRYVVEVPVGVDDYGHNKSSWALDTVTCNEATEFSQEHLGEQIVSHRVISKEEMIALCDKDNAVNKDQTEEWKFKNYVTTWDSQK